jgi:hypothetical protein
LQCQGHPLSSGVMPRILRLIFRFLAALVGVMIMAGLLLIWRLNATPITSTYLTPYIITGLESFIPDTTAEIDHTVLTWDNQEHVASLHADGVRIRDKSGATIAAVPTMDIGLSLVGVLVGRIMPTVLTVDHPQIKLERNSNGSFGFGGMTTSPSAGSTGNAKNALVEAVDDLVQAHLTHRLEVIGAVFDVHDLPSNSNWAVHIPEITLERIHGELTGQVKIEVHQKDHISTLDLHYVYDRSRALHTLSSQFADITPAFFAGGHPETLGLQPAAIFALPLTGEISASFNNSLNAESIAVNIHGDAGSLIFPTFWSAPRSIKSLDVKASYDRKSQTLNIPAATINFGGPKLNLSLVGHGTASSTHDLDFNLSLRLDNLPIDQFDQLWPKPVVKDAREWIVAHLSKGKIDHGDASFKGTLSWNDLDSLALPEGKGTLNISGVRVDYLDGMQPVDDVAAAADFDFTKMTIQITQGHTGNIAVMPFPIYIAGFENDTQTIEIPLKVSGAVPDVLRLIDAPRLRYAKAIGLSPEDIQGKIDGTVTFKFPLVKDLTMKDIEIKTVSNLTNIMAPHLVKGLDITQGNLVLTLDKEGFSLNGTTDLNKIPMQVSWQQYFKTIDAKPLKDIKVTGTIYGEQLKGLGIPAFDGTHGPLAIYVELTRPDDRKTLYFGTIEAAAADVRVDQLNWKKPANIPTTLRFSGESSTGDNILIKSIEIMGPQIKIKGDAVISADTLTVFSLNFDSMMIGRTNASLHFSRDKGETGEFHFGVEGPSLDVSGLRAGKDPAHADPRTKEYRINVDKLYTSDNGFITDAKGYALRDNQGWDTISLHGLADGSHQLDIDLKAQEDIRVFSITCDDFGEALKGMGFTDTVKEGKLNIHGQSTADNPRVIEGEAKIGHFVVRNLPVLALLLNATSPFGLTGIFTDSADFSRLNGKFRWQADAIELKDVHAAGPGVGLNIDGKVDMNSGAANLNGTIVPFSMINRVLNNIPLVGDLITGGAGGGVLAVAYTIGGTLADPKINVNPVSLLTPGFLRNFFFNSDDSGDVPNEPVEKNP